MTIKAAVHLREKLEDQLVYWPGIRSHLQRVGRGWNDSPGAVSCVNTGLLGMKMFHDKQVRRKETFTVTLRFPTWRIVHVLTLHNKQKERAPGGILAAAKKYPHLYFDR